MQFKPRAALLGVGLLVLVAAQETFGDRMLSHVGFNSLSATPFARPGITGSEAPVRIAYINPQALLAAAPGRPAAESLLSRDVARDEAIMKKAQDSITTLIAKYQKDEPTLSVAARDKNQKTIQALEADFQAKQSQFQQQLQQRQVDLMAPVNDVVNKVLADIRDEGGYSVIFSNDPRAPLIATADKNLDITDKVISRLRATAAPRVGPPPTTGAPPAPAGATSPPRPPSR